MAYARYESVAVNTAGDVIPNATIEVREDRAGRPVVPLWANRDGTEPLGNPIKADELGKFGFYVKGGSYYIRVFTGPSQQPFQQYVRRHQAIGTAAERDVEDLATALETGTATFPSLAELEAFAPTAQGVGGKVTTGPAAGFYHRNWETNAWVFDRPLFDTLARMVVTGGTSDAIEAEVETGVADSAVVMLWIEAPGDNTGPVTINGKPVLTIDGAELLAGQWLAGRTYWFTIEGDHYKLRTESDVSGLVAQAEAAATAALGASGAAAGAAGAAATSANEAAGYAAGLNIAPIAPGDAGKILQVNEGEDGSDWAEPPNPITDGDKGDIEVTGGGAVWELKNGVPNVVSSIPAMKALISNRPAMVRSYYGDGRGGGGLFVPDPADTTTADNGGSVIVRADGMRMKRANASLRDIDVLEWGVSSALADNTSRYNAIIGAAPDGAVIRWTKSDAAYLGHFMNHGTGKSFRLEGRGAQVKNTLDNQPLISQQGTVALIATATNTAVYGAISINVASVAGLAVGDLIYVHDAKSYNATFANTELLKIRSISGLTIGVADMFRSNQDNGAINIYKLTPLKDPSISGFEAILNNTHVTNVLSTWYCERPNFQNNIIRNSAGRAVDIRWCHAPFVDQTKIIEPRIVDSGYGYGVSVSDSRDITVHNTFARGCRHAVDCDAVYGGEIRNTTNEAVPGKQSLTVVAPCHVGFGGNIIIDGVYGHGISSYGVGISAQGLANPNAHITRDWSIRNLRVYSDLPVDQQSYGVYVQMAYSGLIIEDVQLELPPGGDLNTLAAACIRLNGQCHGHSLIQGIRSNRATAGLIITIDGTVPAGLPPVGLLSVKDVFLNYCNHAIWVRGVKNIETHSLGSNSVFGAVRTVITPHNGITTVTNITVGNASAIN